MPALRFQTLKSRVGDPATSRRRLIGVADGVLGRDTCSHPFVERLIGTIRREFLDHVPFWNAGDLERKLAEFQVYYNAARSHASLDGYTPLTVVDRPPVAPTDLNQVRWVTHCRGLVQLPVAA